MIVQNVNYRYCPNCKTDLIEQDRALQCVLCNSIIYPSAAVAVGVLPIENRKVLLAKRGVDPQKGMYDTIGGFLEYGEAPEEAAHRETLEETGLKIEIIHLLGIYPDYYGPASKTIVIQYIVKITSGEPKPADDVDSLRWFDINNTPEVLGFDNTRRALGALKEWCRVDH